MDSNLQTETPSNIPPPTPANDQNPLNPALSPDAQQPANKIPRNLKLPYLIIILLVFITVVIILLVSTAKKLFNSPQTPGPSPTISFPTPLPVNPTASFTEYKNEKLGFALKIPGEWQVDDSTDTSLVRIMAPDQSLLEIYADENGEDNLDAYLKAYDTVNETAWEGQPSKKVLESQDTFVGKYTARLRLENWLAAGFETAVVYAEAENRIFVFTVIPTGGNFRASEVYKNLETILPTFDLLKWTDISRWKLWTDPNEFTFKYPSGAKVGHLNLETSVSFVYGNRNVTISFKKIDEKSALPGCSGKCDQTKSTDVKFGGQTVPVTQVWPNINNDRTFAFKIAYPGNYHDKYLAVSATYPEEGRLFEINQILSTFVFLRKNNLLL